MTKQILVVLAGLFVSAGLPAAAVRGQENLQAPAGAQTTNSPPPAESSDALTLPTGTTLRTQLTVMLDTKSNEEGDPFTARVVEPIIAHGEEIVPVGSLVEGRIAMLKKPGRATGAAEMRLVIESLTTTDRTHYDLTAGLQDAQGAEGAKVKDQEGTIQGPGKSKKGAAKETGIGAAAGAGVGALADGGTGSLYGLGIGAAAGVIHSLNKRHKDVVLPAGTELTFIISRTVTGKRTAKPAETTSQ